MRIIVVWVTAAAIIFMVSLCWWSTLPAVIGTSHSLNSTYYESANARNIAKGIEYAAYLWGPLLIGFVLLWAVVSSQRSDIESSMYR